jgi:hypothetical protein
MASLERREMAVKNKLNVIIKKNEKLRGVRHPPLKNVLNTIILLTYYKIIYKA